MSNEANELLAKMVVEYEKSNVIEFDNIFYLGYSETALNELYNEGYIEFESNIMKSIILQPTNL